MADLFNAGNYATFDETCSKCHKNGETKCMYLGEDKMDTCDLILDTCEKCIENTAEEGEICYGDESRDYFYLSVRNILKILVWMFPKHQNSF